MNTNCLSNIHLTKPKRIIINDYLPKEIAIIMFTSGSEGKKKGVLLSHKNILTTYRNIIKFCGYDKNSFEVITLPISHSFGLGQLNCLLLVGGGAYLSNGLTKLKSLFKAIKKYKATGFPTTPLGIELLLNNYKLPFYEASKNIKTMVINSAPLSPLTTKLIMSTFPKVNIIVYYGLTEASRTTFANLNKMDQSEYKTVGKPLGDISICIDSNTKEISISGSNVSLGYLGEKSFDKNKNNNFILKTGDKGTIDKKGNLYVLGRIKDQINFGGYKIDPVEVENCINELDSVKESLVYGKNDENNNEIIIALVVKKIRNCSEDTIFKKCKLNLENYKIPKKIIFIDSIPRGVNGKIDRKKIPDLNL